MSYRERGQSEVLGAILLFAMLISLIVLLQVSAVPGWNQQVEYEHSQRTQGDLTDLADNAGRVAAAGSPESTTVEAGTTYPTRPFLLNPADPQGSVTTETAGPLSLDNVQAVDPETDQYWDDNPGPYPRQALVYSAQYNEYSNAPTTRFDGTVLYTRGTNGESVLLDGGGVVDGNRITLVTLAGERSETTTGTTTVSLQPVSAPMESVSVTGRNGDPIVIRFESGMSEERWGDVLDPEKQNGHVLDWDCTPGGQACGTLEIRLDGSQTYDLRMARVGVGTGAGETEGAYITTVGSSDRRVTQANTDEVTVQVRDAFNNPVAGVTVDFSVANGDISSQQVTTDEEGEATVTFTATENGTASVTASADFEDDPGTVQPHEEATVTYHVLTPEDATTDVGANINPGYDGSVVLVEDVLQGSNNCRAGTAAQDCVAVLTFENRGDATRTIDEVRVSVYVASQPGQGSRDRPESLVVRQDVAAGTAESPVMQIRGDYTDVTGITPSFDAIDPNEQKTLTFKYYADEGGTQPYGAANGDFYVVTIIYGDGTSAIYFVAPTK